MAPHWPAPYGRGAGPAEQLLIDQEMSSAGVIRPDLVIGWWAAPTILEHGTPEQVERFVPGTLRGDIFWCQLFSEPEAGSDLASLRTSAVRDGDHYVVNGQKTWNTLGQYADWIFCLVRTSSEARPQSGISFLLIDMKTPGISVRPIITLEGEHEINDIFFENVRVPLTNLVGEENKGWTYAKFLLNHERTSNAGVGNCKRSLAQLKQIAAAQSANGRALLEDPRFRDRIAQVELELMALEITNLRVLSAFARENRPPGAEVSALKIKGSEIIQQLAELKMHALGHDALPYLREALDPEWSAEALLGSHYPACAPSLSGQYFNLRKTTIYAGSTEIQKNIISKMILGL